MFCKTKWISPFKLRLLSLIFFVLIFSTENIIISSWCWNYRPHPYEARPQFVRQSNTFIELAKSVANYHPVDWPLVKETFVKVGTIRLSVTTAVNAFLTGLTTSARYVPRKGKTYQISESMFDNICGETVWQINQFHYVLL